MEGKVRDETPNLLKFPVERLDPDWRILTVPLDLQWGIVAVARRTGYTTEEVLRFMLEEAIQMARHQA